MEVLVVEILTLNFTKIALAYDTLKQHDDGSDQALKLFRYFIAS